MAYWHMRVSGIPGSILRPTRSVSPGRQGRRQSGEADQGHNERVPRGAVFSVANEGATGMPPRARCVSSGSSERVVVDFDLTEEQREFYSSVVRFAQSELDDDVGSRDMRAEFPRALWKKCATFGIHGLFIPEEFGGQGADALDVILAMEALGYGCRDNGLLFSINAHMWSCELPVLRFGDDDQRRRYLPGLCDGSLIGVQGMTEPGSGSDAFSLTTRADKSSGGWTLHGSKTYVTNGPVADLFVVFASTDRRRGFGGLSAFLVERDTPGLSIGEPMHKMGLRTSPMSELFFDGCTVSDTSCLGPQGAGMAIFNTSIEWERSCILASAVGTMQRQLERCISFANQREQFGRPIGKFQAVSHRIVDMKVRLEAARLLLYKLGWEKARSRKSRPMDAAIVKLVISDAFVHSSLDAMQVHGAYGYMAEDEFERDVRDALGSRIYSGTSDIQRNIIAHHLGL